MAGETSFRGLVREAIPASPVLTTVASLLFRGRLRIIAYHDVLDRSALRAQINQLRERFQLVDADQVVSWSTNGTSLPHDAVWITFDDGRPGALDAADELADLGVRATAFVCPGVIGTTTPFWWEVVDCAIGLGVAPPTPWPVPSGISLLTAIKRQPDDVRRRYVEFCQSAVETATGNVMVGRQATWEQVDRWARAGHDVGNHTWDHPTLDTCSATATQVQVLRAHDALTLRYPGRPLLFAYPNGDLSPVAEQTLTGLGYHLRLLFDHALAKRGPGPLSRLRLDADAGLRRSRAVVSGSHSLLFHAARRWSR